ncbi:GNAT family N-acetyltransferase, partial [Streptomyces sp. T-3]|nr:GNAT family N-acetyltransferase [Streptomyces sp. T-3]
GRPSLADLPPLLRGYLRLGAWMCGAPAYDAEFGVADFYVLLPMDRVSERYRRYFLGEADAGAPR